MNWAAIISAKIVHGRARLVGRDATAWVVVPPGRTAVVGRHGSSSRVGDRSGCHARRRRRSLTPGKSPGLVSGTCAGTLGTVLSCWPAGTPNARAIAALLDAARAGRGGALVVRGVAGAGKSTLLADALAAATEHAGAAHLRAWSRSRRWRSPRCSGCCGRCAAGSSALPAPQQAALRAALGEAEGEGDRFLAFLGTLSLLADAAEERAGAGGRRRRPLARRRLGRGAAVRRPPAAGRAGRAAVRRPRRRRPPLRRRRPADRRPRRGDRRGRRRAAGRPRRRRASTRRCATSWSPAPAATRWRWSSWPACSPPSSWPAGRRCRARCR